jgi:hypothetical protein
MGSNVAKSQTFREKHIVSICKPPSIVHILFDLIFGPEDGGETWLYPSYTTLQPRKSCSLSDFMFYIRKCGTCVTQTLHRAVHGSNAPMTCVCTRIFLLFLATGVSLFHRWYTELPPTCERGRITSDGAGNQEILMWRRAAVVPTD